jgi:hypothetical protein
MSPEATQAARAGAGRLPAQRSGRCDGLSPTKLSRALSSVFAPDPIPAIGPVMKLRALPPCPTRERPSALPGSAVARQLRRWHVHPRLQHVIFAAGMVGSLAPIAALAADPADSRSGYQASTADGVASPVATLAEQGRLGRISRIEGRAAWFVDDAGIANHTRGASDGSGDGQVGWREARENLPVVSRSSIATEGDGRVEVRIGDVSVLLDGDSQADFVRVEGAAVEIRVVRGAVGLEVPSYDSNRQLQLDSDRVRLRVRNSGAYVLRQLDDGAVQAKTLDGQADLKVGSATLSLISGQQARIEGGDALSYQRGPLAMDTFDRWTQERGRHWQSLAASPFVPADITGADELATHGQWVQDPSLGPLWYPVAAPPGWAPYQAGHWVSIEPWGPVWVDAAPWGFVTSHRGGWREVRGRWAWQPGARVVVARPMPPVAVGPVYRPPQWRWQHPPMPLPIVSVPPGQGPTWRPGEGYRPGFRDPQPYRPAPAAPVWQPPAPMVTVRPQPMPPVHQPAMPGWSQPVPQPYPQPMPQAIPQQRGSQQWSSNPMPYPTPPRDFAQPPRDFNQPRRDFNHGGAPSMPQRTWQPSMPGQGAGSFSAPQPARSMQGPSPPAMSGGVPAGSVSRPPGQGNGAVLHAPLARPSNDARNGKYRLE